jgi:hypothetical protein
VLMPSLLLVTKRSTYKLLQYAGYCQSCTAREGQLKKQTAKKSPLFTLLAHLAQSLSLA